MTKIKTRKPKTVRSYSPRCRAEVFSDRRLKRHKTRQTVNGRAISEQVK